LESRRIVEKTTFRYVLRKLLFDNFPKAAHQFLLQPIATHPKAEEAFGVWSKDGALAMSLTINTDGICVYSGPPDSTLVICIPITNIQNYPRAWR
jgi:hypothetical protein